MIRIVVVIVALVLSACAHQLAPGPGAHIAGGPGRAAVASAADVTVVAGTDTWRAFPADISGIVTPLLVTIDNQSGRPLRVRYEQLALRGPGETVFAARSPYEIDGYVSEPVAALPYGAYGYDPFWHRPVGAYGWGRPYGWYDPWPMTRSVRLPTTEMVQLALPEMVVESGARVRGFVFFDRATKRKGTPLELTMDLVDARTGEPFGEVRIPLVVQ